jgi:hypothetical protein
VNEFEGYVSQNSLIVQVVRIKKNTKKCPKWHPKSIL